MNKIVIQAGHVNTQFNIDPALHGSTGAPGEQEFTLRIASRLSEMLRARGFEVKQTDANANADSAIVNVDWNLFLAIHYEADVHGMGGGMITAPDPSVDDVNVESRRIAESIKRAYYVPYTNDTEIVEQPTWISNNMTFYYMWRYLTSKTPCVLIECGVGQNAHDKVILADTERVCMAIAKGICKAFGVPFDVGPTPTPQPAPNYQKGSGKFDQVVTYLNSIKLLSSGNAQDYYENSVVVDILKGQQDEAVRLKKQNEDLTARIYALEHQPPPVPIPGASDAILEKVKAIVYSKWTFYPGKNYWVTRLHQLKSVFETQN